MKKNLGIIGIVLLAELVVSLAIIYSGMIDVSASKPEGTVREWLFRTALRRSVNVRSGSINVPPLKDSTLMRIGFDHYNEMCVTCHGAPGKEPDELAAGLNPPAPDLSFASKSWTPSELYQIIQNGVKMTGMPAFGVTHDSRSIWGMVAFLKELPRLSPEMYRELSAREEEENAQISDEHSESREHHHQQ